MQNRAKNISRRLRMIAAMLFGLMVSLPLIAGASSTATLLQSSPASVSAAPGKTFNLTYNWQAVPLSQNYTVFVHFLDSAGVIVFGDDHQPPTATTAWSGNISYTRTITVPANAPLGNYQINVGLYSGSTRIALNAGSGVIANISPNSEGSYAYEIGTLQVAQGTSKTTYGVPLPSGWSLKVSDKFGTQGNVNSYAALHTKYYEGQYYNTNKSGLVIIPNVVINSEQETYQHFETSIAFSPDHLTIQARGQSNGTINSAEIVSLYAARSFCVEARYTIPSAMYSWPAFWMYGNAPGHDLSEIDVEQPVTANQGVGNVSLYNHPTQGNVTITDPKFTTQWMTWTNPSFNGSSAPHVYTSCYNDATSTISRYIDGAEIYYSSGWKWNASLGGTGYGPNASTIVNLAVGGNWPGNTPNPKAFSANLDLYSIEYYGP